MKKLFLILITVITLYSLMALPVLTEDISDETGCFAETLDLYAQSLNPRYPSETCLFELNYTNAQKAAILRDFLVERLANLEKYEDELTLAEHCFSGYYSSDTLCIDLSEFTEFEMYTNSVNKASTQEILSIAVNEIGTKYPSLFWIDDESVYWTTQNKVVKIEFKLNCYTNFNTNNGLNPVIKKINSLTDEFNGYVHKITDLIPDNYSDYEKILFVNDYLCLNHKYDYNYKIYNAYEFFKEGTGVCQAYTLAFMACMDELNIKCDYVRSQEMNHAWNLVQLNEKWYHIDVTWNDPGFETENTDTFGQAKHTYFLLSSDCIQDSTHNHYGFDIDSYDYEIGTDYDKVDIDLNRSLKSSFIELNGTWYNTGYDNDTRICGLYAFDSPDISSISNEDFATPLYNIGLWTTSGNRYYPYSYTYLAKHNDTILFNTPTSICVFDGNNVAELYTPKKADDERIYGFTVKDNAICIQLATDPNEDAMSNATIKMVDIVDITYKNHNGDILAVGFAVEGEKIPEVFIPDISCNWYADEICTDGNEYNFDTPVDEDVVLFADLSEYELTIESYDETTKQATIYSPTKTEGVLIFVSYDENNSLIDCDFNVYSGDSKLAEGINKCIASTGFNTEGSKRVKVVLMESLTSLTPLCESLEK